VSERKARKAGFRGASPAAGFLSTAARTKNKNFPDRNFFFSKNKNSLQEGLRLRINDQIQQHRRIAPTGGVCCLTVRRRYRPFFLSHARGARVCRLSYRMNHTPEEHLSASVFPVPADRCCLQTAAHAPASKKKARKVVCVPKPSLPLSRGSPTRAEALRCRSSLHDSLLISIYMSAVVRKLRPRFVVPSTRFLVAWLEEQAPPPHHTLA